MIPVISHGSLDIRRIGIKRRITVSYKKWRDLRKDCRHNSKVRYMIKRYFSITDFFINPENLPRLVYHVPRILNMSTIFPESRLLFVDELSLFYSYFHEKIWRFLLQVSGIVHFISPQPSGQSKCLTGEWGKRWTEMCDMENSTHYKPVPLGIPFAGTQTLIWKPSTGNWL